MKSLNFVKKSISKEDLDLFFGPLDDGEEFFHIKEHWIMAHILTAANIFSSVSQARKNGWNKPIPEGFTMLTVGKKAKKTNLFIFIKKIGKNPYREKILKVLDKFSCIR